jgi:hypothetical protein
VQSETEVEKDDGEEDREMEGRVMKIREIRGTKRGRVEKEKEMNK